MVVIDHVEKVAQPKISVITPVPSKEEQVKPETEGKRSRKTKED